MAHVLPGKQIQIALQLGGADCSKRTDFNRWVKDADL